jgi:hypothetical protein
MRRRTTIVTAQVTGLAVIGAGAVAVAAPGQQQTRAGQASPAGVATQAQQHDPTATLPAARPCPWGCDAAQGRSKLGAGA